MSKMKHLSGLALALTLLAPGGAALAQLQPQDPPIIDQGNLVANNPGFNGDDCTEGWSLENLDVATACRQGTGMVWLNNNGQSNDPAIMQYVGGLTVGARYNLNVKFSPGSHAKTYVKDTNASYFGIEVVDSELGLIKLAPGVEEAWQVRHYEFTASKPDVIIRLVAELDGVDGDVLIDFVHLEAIGSADSAMTGSASSAMIASAGSAMAISRTSSFSMQSHFQAMARVDLGACGAKKSRKGGFGKRRVPTNSHGDVHIFTPDGLTYDFQPEGEFVLIASEDEQIAVHTRQTKNPGNPSVSSNTAVAFKVGADVIEFYSDKEGQRLYVNGEKTELPKSTFGLPGGGHLEPDGKGKSGPRYLINWPDGNFAARVNLYAQFLNVGVSGQGGTYSGLIGNLDGNPSNDMLPRGGSSLICPKAGVDDLIRFGDSWRVSQEETYLRAEMSGIATAALVTDVVSGERISIETAVTRTLEQNFVALGTGQSVDVATISITLGALYNITEEVALQAISTYFERQNLTQTDTIEVASMTTQIESYRGSYERVTIDTIEETARATAQRICEAQGVSDALALANCLMDVVSTQDEAYVESAVSFEKTIVEFPVEQRIVATSFANVLSPTAILPAARVIEIVGPPSVVPSITTLVSSRSTEVENIVTVVTSDITATINQTACAEVEGLQTPVDVLGKSPAAGGVAIFCATHERGQTITVELGRTLEDALARARASCPQAAEERSEAYGEVIIPCREIGRGERSFDFGGGVLSVGRDVTVTQITRIVEKPEVPDGFRLSLTPKPGITADCMEGEIVPLDGLFVEEGLLRYSETEERSFQTMCSKIEMINADDDILLQASCLTETASDARTSAISLLGVAATKALVEHPKCKPAGSPFQVTGDPEPWLDETPEGDFVPFGEDSLESRFPDAGDFVFIRNLEKGIVVNVRRERWVLDETESVFTALRLQVGGDSVEFYVRPQINMLINGLPFEDSGAVLEGEMAVLPGGGSLTLDLANGAVLVEWPGTSFALVVALFPRSHLTPMVRVDKSLTYEGLARFTMDWLLEGADSGFTVPLNIDGECGCAR